MAIRKDLNPTKSPPVNIKPPFVTDKIVTLVEQGPQDQNRREDGYGGHVAPSSTAFETAIGKYIDDAMASYSNLGFGINKITKFLNGLNTSSLSGFLKSITPQDMIDRLTSVLGGRSIQSFIGDTTKFFNKVKSSINNIRRTVMKYVGDFKRLVAAGKKFIGDAKNFYNTLKNNDWKSLAGIVKGLGLISPELGALGRDLLGAVGEGLLVYQGVKDLIKNGRSDIVKMLGLKHKNSPDYRAAIFETIEHAVKNSDISSLQLAVDVLGGNAVLNKYPNFFNSVLVNYQRDPFYSPKTARQARGALLNLFEKTKKDWQYKIHNGNKVTDLGIFSGISEAAKQILLNVPKINPKELEVIKEIIAKAKKDRPTEEEIKKDYEQYVSQLFDQTPMSFEDYRRERLSVLIPGGIKIFLDEADELIRKYETEASEYYDPLSPIDPYDSEKYDFTNEIAIASHRDYWPQNIRRVVNKRFPQARLSSIAPIPILNT